MHKKEFSSHISNQLNRNLEELFHHILEMGGMVENQLDMALTALSNSDVKVAKEVIRFDKTINQAEMEIDRLCIRVLARQQPTASDLRLILSTIRIAIDLERMGDEICKLAKLVINVSKNEDKQCANFSGYAELVDISTRAREMLKVTLNAFARVSADDAISILDQEDIVDQVYKKACMDVTEQFKKSPDHVECLLDVMNALRASERLSDHALNIMESIIYLVQGKDVRDMDQERLTKFLEKISGE
ncbi:MAG: phosphate transport system protein [Thiomicrorhabdus sp.]|nr:MAG: phosphate transport system protein [Thiomicrorhabdus sp.]